MVRLHWLANGSSTAADAAAWLSLDEGDSNPVRFLPYIVTALRTVAPKLGEEALQLIQESQAPPTEAILTSLLNEITADLDPFLLMLDDYHMIDSRAVDEALTFLVEHLPPQMHLVITTREIRLYQSRAYPPEDN